MGLSFFLSVTLCICIQLKEDLAGQEVDDEGHEEEEEPQEGIHTVQTHTVEEQHVYVKH